MTPTQLLPRTQPFTRMQELDALIRQAEQCRKMPPELVEEHQREAKRGWRERNYGRQLDLSRKWHQAHRADRLRKMREAYWANRENRIKAMREYRKAIHHG